ncbi:hypothetical protein Bca52824_030391 [Brassica carinata]|uniref:Uncharacterized protein n=1 Tax=Brassica carinata TaxID=52824 RepID=A0A8X7V363_BRACI|nr:hypothetical protein Bca52824_030391 [Brassica carinata]
MESKSTSGGAIRRDRRLVRYYPYTTGSSAVKEEMKKEVIQLGVKLSLSVVESMFLLCDDIRTMLFFCQKIWRDYNRCPDPVLERLLRVMHYVYLRDIKPKKRVFKNYGQSVQWRLISSAWEDFANGVMVMFRLVRVLRRKDWSYDDRLLFSAIEKYKQVLKRLDDKLRSKKNVSKKNGFMRETIEPNIYDLWKSIFDEEAKETTYTLKEIRNSIISGIFGPIAGKPIHRKIRALPSLTPYILGIDFPKQELKEEAVKSGIELSLLVAQSMFFMRDDDYRSVLWFYLKLWIDATKDRDQDSPVAERLLYVNFIKPKDKTFENDDARWVQWKLIKTTMNDFAAGIRDLDRLVSILRGEGSYLDGREFTSRIEEALKRIDDKLRCTKKKSEENGFAREVMKSNILELWKSLFDKDADEAWKPRVMRMIVSLTDMYKPLLEKTL